MFDESKHPRDEDGKFTEGNGEKSFPQNASYEEILNIEKLNNKTMTPAEKIASVHIDFDRDNILPELNEEDLVKIDCKTNKPVLLKRSVLDRNTSRHNDVMPETETILKHVLYSPAEIFKGNENKPYYTFVKPMRISKRNGKFEYGLALLDVDSTKANFEIVHWHWINEENLDKMKK